MHLATCDDIDAVDFLFHDRGLHGAQLGVDKIARGQLPERHQPVEGLVPSRNAT